LGIVSFEKRNLSNFSGFSCLNRGYTDGFVALITVYNIPVVFFLGAGMVGVEKRPGCDLDRALSSPAEVKNKCFYSSRPLLPPSNMPSLREQGLQLYVCRVSVNCTVLNEVSTKLEAA
jgi:hypothetical protein